MIAPIFEPLTDSSATQSDCCLYSLDIRIHWVAIHIGYHHPPQKRYLRSHCQISRIHASSQLSVKSAYSIWPATLSRMETLSGPTPLQVGRPVAAEYRPSTCKPPKECHQPWSPRSDAAAHAGYTLTTTTSATDGQFFGSSRLRLTGCTSSIYTLPIQFRENVNG